VDDGAAGREGDVLRALSIIETDGPSRGMFLNSAKSEVWSPGGVVPADLSHFHALSPEGFELLGSPVGGAAFCASHFMQRMQKFRSLLAGVTRLPHLQTQALLLRFCSSFCKVVHLVRTVPPHLWEGCLTRFDSEFRSFMEVVTGPTSDFAWAFMSLGYRKGAALRPGPPSGCLPGQSNRGVHHDRRSLLFGPSRRPSVPDRVPA
jgi:hypothetical protein